MNTQKHNRSGDVNLRPIKKLPENLKEIKHNGEYITARGEATGSVHKLVAKRVSDMKLMTDEKGNVYLEVFNPITHSHTHDHQTITVMPGIYKQVAEREKDWFLDGIERKVVD